MNTEVSPMRTPNRKTLEALPVDVTEGSDMPFRHTVRRPVQPASASEIYAPCAGSDERIQSSGGDRIGATTPFIAGGYETLMHDPVRLNRLFTPFVPTFARTNGVCINVLTSCFGVAFVGVVAPPGLAALAGFRRRRLLDRNRIGGWERVGQRPVKRSLSTLAVGLAVAVQLAFWVGHFQLVCVQSAPMANNEPRAPFPDLVKT
ncbi:MAG: hypothetical protein ACREDY_15795 [Bradyrhizobium sp.]